MAGSEERYSSAMESLVLLAESMQQASALLADAEDDGDEATNQPASFLNVVALGSVVRAHTCFSITFLYHNSRNFSSLTHGLCACRGPASLRCSTVSWAILCLYVFLSPQLASSYLMSQFIEIHDWCYSKSLDHKGQLVL